MITKAIREEHPHPRPLNITVEHFFKGYPGFSMLMPKSAAWRASGQRAPAAPRRGAARAGVPEGRKGTEKLYKDRYRLRRFGRGGFVEAAMRAGADRAGVRGRRRGGRAGVRPPGACQAPHRAALRAVTPTFPHLGPLGMLGYMPAKFKLRFLEPIRFDERACTRTRRSCRPWRTRWRADPGGPLGHACPSQVGVVRMTSDSKRILITGLSTYWGGLLAQALEADEVEAIDRGGQRGAQRRARAHRVREGRRPARAAAARGRGGRDRHPGGHPAGGRLGGDLAPHGPREQRDRHDEHPGRVRRAGSVRKFVFKSSTHFYGAEQDDRLLRRGDGPPAPAPHADRARHVEAEASVAHFADKNPGGQ